MSCEHFSAFDLSAYCLLRVKQTISHLALASLSPVFDLLDIRREPGLARTDVARLLLEKQADINAEVSEQTTPIHQAMGASKPITILAERSNAER